MRESFSDWMSDRYVSVHADGIQVKDGGGAGPDINRQLIKA